mmetsp:Transcript_123573/g.218921  ORF Transcript_123573/g.218921 Transcript_123573/m.218921 type:complete len:662 (+) Transcript_123573:71-2056(+)
MASTVPACRRTLHHMLTLMLALLSGAFALVGRAQSDAANADSSITQIRDTLQNLLRSVEDAGREAEGLYTKRQHWCTSALHSFEASSSATDSALVQLREDLTEHEAAVEEAVGTVRQVRADIALVQHTINQTQELLQARQHAETSEVEKGQIALKELQSRGAEGNTAEMRTKLLQTRSKMKNQFEADAGLLRALVANKQQGLASLNGQLEVALPALAQLQAKVAEARERIQDRTDTVSASRDFSTALRHACSAGSQRADTQAAARVSEAASVEAALQALEGLSDEVQGQMRAPVATSAVVGQEDGEVNFLQVGQGEAVTTEDLVDLFSGGRDQTADTAFANDDLIQHAKVTDAPAATQPPRVALAPLKNLLAQLKSSVSADSQHEAWCTQEREQNEFTLKVAQDAVAQLASEVEAHADSEAELTEDLGRINTSMVALVSINTQILKSESQEQAFLRGQVKDQQLATKILAQASTIVGELGVSPGSQANPHHLKQQRKIVVALNEAAAAFRTQLQSASSFAKELTATTKEITQKATVAADVLSREKRGAEMTRDEHTSQRLKTIADKEAGDEEVKEAMQYLQTLAQSCKSDAFAGVGQETKAQIHALEDAKTVLEGRSLSASNGEARGLRGGALKKPIRKRPLTPMERAAAEMGVDVDTSDE